MHELTVSILWQRPSQWHCQRFRGTAAQADQQAGESRIQFAPPSPPDLLYGALRETSSQYRCISGVCEPIYVIRATDLKEKAIGRQSAYSKT
jgi:hypothetical protein